MLVSVVMSVYDGDNPNYLKKAIESILNQTYKNIEFIIILDGVKRKDLREIIYHYKEATDNIVVDELSENKGLAYALNRGIKLAKGDYLIRMDADDISYPKRIEKLVEHMKANNDLDVLGSFVEEFSENSEIKKIVKYPIKHKNMKELFAKRNPIAHSSVIFRRRFFDKAGFYQSFSIRNEDTLLWLSGFINGCNFSNLPEVLYSIRFNDGMISRRVGIRKSFSDLIDRLRVIIDLRASFINIFYAIGVFVIQNMPYSIYNYFRSKIISKESNK